MARGTPNSFSSSSSQSRVFKFNSMVREALVTSVACTCPLVRFQISQLSMVPKGFRPPPSRALHVLQQPFQLGGGKIGIQQQPGLGA